MVPRMLGLWLCLLTACQAFPLHDLACSDKELRQCMGLDCEGSFASCTHNDRTRCCLSSALTPRAEIASGLVAPALLVSLVVVLVICCLRGGKHEESFSGTYNPREQELSGGRQNPYSYLGLPIPPLERLI